MPRFARPFVLSPAGRRGWIVWSLVALIVVQGAQSEEVSLRNGMRLKGIPGTIFSLQNDANKATIAGDVKLRSIWLVDDDLRRVFFGNNQLNGEPKPTDPSPLERIKIPQRVAENGKQIFTVGATVHVSPFDENGRRIYSMMGPNGVAHIVQGITEITPTYTKVEALAVQSDGTTSYVWSTRLATSSIPRDTLAAVLKRAIPQQDSNERLHVVRLYMQSERYSDAKVELDVVQKDFPNLDLTDQRKAITQLAAKRVLNEVQFRREVGQYRLALGMLQNFPSEGVAGETLLQVRDLQKEYEEIHNRGKHVLDLLELHQKALADDKARADVKPICAEIAADLNVNNLDRFVDYMRLADDKSTTAEQKLSLAISGWLLGGGAAIDNLAVAKSLVQVRTLIRTYLASKQRNVRDAALAKLKELEGSSPDYVAKIIKNMKPLADEQPLDLAKKIELDNNPEAPDRKKIPPADLDLKPVPNNKPAPKAAAEKKEVADEPLDPAEKEPSCGPKDADDLLGDLSPKKPPAAKPAGEPGAKNNPPVAKPGERPADKPADLKEIKKAPAAGQEKEKEPEEEPAGEEAVVGLLELTVPGPTEQPNIKYHVQLPPEYDPYRKYPVIVTLHTAGASPLQQIDWWTGTYSPNTQIRLGTAARHGYIVVAPAWTREHQVKYEYSAREHAAVLYPLRDVMARFSVDTDKIFLSGHAMGGDAAWDIGLAHPDLWAGVVPIVATADKYIGRYWKNTALLPFYFVLGEKDSGRWAQNATEWDRYLKQSNTSLYDVMVVQYLGRGHEHFHDEIKNIMEWMSLHKRNFFPQNFLTNTMRPWDNYFWYVESDNFPEASMVNPIEWPPGRGSQPTKVEAHFLSKTNHVTVDSGGKKVRVWLAPEMVDFSKKVVVNINNRDISAKGAPNIADLLEDVRTRCDRVHPFWGVVSN